ncbi:PilW family protein [Colwellia echini]|uniref:Prepilin-type N-terminal cleavage/methylation domain-containing protein n=1 Tax=Colwellia echini TaxID=1982103 RepID=A0ABY3MVF7_9GAMM|nr:PilW family protein [Colwellia echini]TYK65192.1 prepilin-type N-terminal cleavage/methylation domain-containing protein [Colwellia echini]
MKSSFKKYKNNQHGFTLLELILSLSVGVVILAGVSSVFIGMQSTVKETSNYGELQENARFAISLITDDLMQQNFWGDYSGSINASNLNGVIPVSAGVECIGEGTNNGTYPLATGQFRTLWGETSSPTGVTAISCIGDAAANSDVIQFKRVISNPFNTTDATPPSPPVGFSYFISNVDEAAIYKIPTVGVAVAPVIKNSRIWQYQHHIYYVRAGVPVLMKWRLTTQMINEPVVDGIERIYFMYGVSNQVDPSQPGFGVINSYISAENMTAAQWDNTNSRILAVKVYVLARSILPDDKYKNENTYVLGDQAPYTPDDNFRRLLLSSTVTLFNAEIDTW